MKIHLILVTMLISVTIRSQTSFHLVYKVTNVPADTNGQHLNTYTKNGNSVNDFSADRDNVVWNRCVTRMDQPKYKFDYHRGSYIKMPNNQLKKYLVEIVSADTIQSVPCTKISVQTYDNGEKVLLWVPGQTSDYHKFTSGVVQDFDLVKLNTALQAHKLIGFPLRIEYTGYRGQIYELTLAEPFEIDDEHFEVDDAKRMKGYSAEKLKRKGKVTDEQYKAMKEAEEAAKKQAMEDMQRK